MPKKPFETVPDKDLQRVIEIADSALRLRRKGLTDGRQLESAIGAMFLGLLFGYRVLEIMHNYRTRRRYCELLGISSFRDICPSVGSESDRHHVYRIAKSVKNFWRAIAGENKELPRELLEKKNALE